MKVTMKIIDDGNVDQRKLFRLVTKQMRAIINGQQDTIAPMATTTTTTTTVMTTEKDVEHGRTLNTTTIKASINKVIGSSSIDDNGHNQSDVRPNDNNDVGDDDKMVSVESVEYETGETRDDLESLFHPKTHSLRLRITKKNITDEEKLQNVPFTINEKEGLTWNLSSVEPFSRNEQRIRNMYSKKLMCGWSAASLRVSAIIMLDIISNSLLIIDVAQGAENMTAYRYARGRTIQLIGTIVILSVAIFLNCMQLYAVAFTRLRTCPTLTVFSVPPMGFPSTSFKSSSRDDIMIVAGSVMMLLSSGLVVYSFAIAWGGLVAYALLVVVMVPTRAVRLPRGIHDEDLSILEMVMWFFELHTAFYLPFAHTASTATIIASAIDAVAELLELGHSLFGSKGIEVGGMIILRPDASEEDIMWSYMNRNASKFVNVAMDLTALGVDDATLELQRFVTLLNLFSLDGAGDWSVLTRSPAWESRLNDGVGRASISVRAIKLDDTGGDIDVYLFTFGGRSYKLVQRELSIPPTSVLLPPETGEMIELTAE